MTAIFDIATMGTSLTAGSGAEQSFHRDLAAALRTGKECTLRLYNHGIPGGYSSDGLATVQNTVAMRPEVVLIEYSMNDCLTSLSTSESNTISIINALRTGTPDSVVYLMTMNPVVGSGASATSRSALPTFYQLYRDLSVSQSVGLIDTSPGWAGVTVADIPDGVHPTVAANRTYLIPAIAAALSPLIP